MFSSARLAQLGMLAVIAVFGSSMAILARGSFSKVPAPKAGVEEVREAPMAEASLVVMDSPKNKEH